ncbi:putative membrane protein [Ralstonia insidiosa]|uniref:Membrane protein n=1 Tax=Ralstonia insidiosa TaxID=190721 RepID=A0AAC9BDQ7_9RALS|nr:MULTISPECIES: hypothetical protein [Ralstonia]ANH72218.1 putative membrane protein [Ralstonia insidiosa]EPX97941.1 hypothetical protein C404_10635 [Ralstonia sp. AU12-08]MBY4704120.1 hypothetical protein [Ralstonia insidiosa]GAQ30932.1 hypothetical protein SAMD00023378_4615 [Ralstonia sp. NT80]
MLELIADFILEAFLWGFLWGTGAILIKIFTFNRRNPREVGQSGVAILGMVFWVLAVLLVGRQIL